MVLDFGYKGVKKLDGREVKEPLIPVVLQGKRSLLVNALIDSGADMSAIQKRVAELLGIDLAGSISSSYGIGGFVNSVKTKIDIFIEDNDEKYHLHIPIKIVLTEDDFPILLGRDGFFDRFVITFNQPKEKVSLNSVIGA